MTVLALTCVWLSGMATLFTVAGFAMTIRDSEVQKRWTYWVVTAFFVAVSAGLFALGWRML